MRELHDCVSPRVIFNTALGLSELFIIDRAEEAVGLLFPRSVEWRVVNAVLLARLLYIYTFGILEEVGGWVCRAVDTESISVCMQCGHLCQRPL